jgi:hypothetical protein
MGWEDMHMYAFVIDGEDYGDPRRGGDCEYDSRSVSLSEIVEQGDTRFRYGYDFGDDWEHSIEIEKTLPAEEGVKYPRCVGGKRACPPEDCGGPYGYPDFLDRIQDPKHEEHEEALDWVGDEFDPERFDLNRTNEDLYHLRRWLGKRQGRNAPSAFAKGDLVRVKPGIVHDRYPDIPLGGWVGTIKRIGWLTPRAYAVHWTRPTLDQAHAVYFKRCRRDDLQPHRCWLEEDQLEAATDETPVAMEQPTNFMPEPLSLDDDIEDYEEDDGPAGPLQFPIGTIAYYGPDDKITTKIVAGVIKEEDAEPIIKRWVATDVTTNPKVRKEIDRFFQTHGVTQVGMSQGNMGCPHEEGEDFPDGGDCPFCPWWKGKQGSGAKE